eukprot:gnl/TRDRNA2_/TRDRNA2_81450_c0_seq2.p1 gnl/TRDRNA2_/TRDRNA2_81450_c0~~gnl/TRDRNA2_/TRDRNA2_81450_c0_seq2.p1  ORF type:complete len:309 (-),score=53.20 gnl/TRDRNA2_/TRDRNA2_81450_c0_seq2:24-950(-)
MGSDTVGARDFARAAMQRFAFQALEEQGFTLVESSAVELLSEAVTQYLEAAGTGARQLAELGGRASVNLADAREALARLPAAFGSHAPLLSEGDLEVLGEEEDLGTVADDVPEFPRNRWSGPCGSLALSAEEAEEGVKRRGNHIPAFLPPFPPPSMMAPQSAGRDGSTKGAPGSGVEKPPEQSAVIDALLELSATHDGGTSPASEPLFGEHFKAAGSWSTMDTSECTAQRAASVTASTVSFALGGAATLRPNLGVDGQPKVLGSVSDVTRQHRNRSLWHLQLWSTRHHQRRERSSSRITRLDLDNADV